MDKMMMQCERLGINPKWPKYKTVLKPIIAFEESWAKTGKTLLEADLESIRKYVSREDMAPTEFIPNDTNATKNAAEDIGRLNARKVLARAPDNPDWLKELSHWARYYQVGVRQCFFWHHRSRIIFPGNPEDSLHMFSMADAAHMMGAMALLGWKEAAIYQGYLTHAALNRGYQLVIQYRDEHRRTQAFMLRLFADWVGDVSHQWPSYGYDEPIYEALLAHWRTPDPDDLVPCLLAACDRHTWQSGRQSMKRNFDFNQDNHLQRTPIEILFLFRLREWEGLANPVLDHPLMAPPFNRLPPAQQVPELDEPLQGILKRAREDWPQYDEVLSLEALKANQEGVESV